MTPFLIVPIAFLMLFIVAIYFSFKRIAALRQVLNARIESLSQEQSRLLRRLDGVDEKTTERTKADYETVSQKFADAIRIAARGRDQDFARAGRVLDNTQTKLENAHARLDRFNERIEAKLTRQAEAEQRRAERSTLANTGALNYPKTFPFATCCGWSRRHSRAPANQGATSQSRACSGLCWKVKLHQCFFASR